MTGWPIATAKCYASDSKLKTETASWIESAFGSVLPTDSPFVIGWQTGKWSVTESGSGSG